MPTIHYVSASGADRAVEVRVGDSIMEGGIKHNIVGLVGECGGACACATCHVYVDPDWKDRTGRRTVAEEGMLEFLEAVQDTSRLSCQIKVTPLLDGLVVRLPDHQTSQL